MFEQAIEKFMKQHRELLDSGKMMSDAELERQHHLFKQKFGPEVIKTLDGDALLERMFVECTNWLEYKNDEEFQTGEFGGIGGGSAAKFIIFRRANTNQWADFNGNINYERALEIARDVRDGLVEICNRIGALRDDNQDDYLGISELSKKLINNLGTYVWVHKYLHMIYPDKIDAFHNGSWQEHVLVQFGEKPIDINDKYISSYQIMKIAHKVNLSSYAFSQVFYETFGGPRKYYRIGTTSEERSYWPEMRDNNFISIGWPALGDLNQYNHVKNKTEFKDALMDSYLRSHNAPNNIASRKLGEIYVFYRELKPGDIVIACEGATVQGIGRIVGDYEYDANSGFPNKRAVEWSSIGETSLPKKDEGIQTTVYPIKDVDNLLAINQLILNPKPIPESKSGFKTILKPALDDVSRKIERILARKSQVILYGPPGTGKTYYAMKTARELVANKVFDKRYIDLSEDERQKVEGDKRSRGYIRMCCFHPSYGYEDFIEGIKPHVENGATLFEQKDGIFKQLCQDAQNDTKHPYFLIIDEINRGDVSRIFGELIMLMEQGKRGETLQLPISGDAFSIPSNVFIIGTMNTADRSIALLDAALRRRFGFYEFMPSYNVLGKASVDNLYIGKWLESLNKRICNTLGKDARNLQIGHSYFLENGKPIQSESRFKEILVEDILPLIEEYCYGDYDAIAQIIGSSFVDKESQKFIENIFDETGEFITALLQADVSVATSIEVQTEDAEDDDADE